MTKVSVCVGARTKRRIYNKKVKMIVEAVDEVRRDWLVGSRKMGDVVG